MIKKFFLGSLLLALAACARAPRGTPSLQTIRLPMGYIPIVQFAPFYIAQADLFVLPAVAVLGLLAGLVPSVQAYRLGVIKNLTPVS